MGIDEREPHGTTIFNTLLYFGPDGRLLEKHRKLMPTGSERTVWGMGDGVDAQRGGDRPGTCGRAHLLGELHAARPLPPLRPGGAQVSVAPTLAQGDGWIATMRHIAREGRVWVIGANPCHASTRSPPTSPTATVCGSTPDDDADDADSWVEPGNSVICNPNGEIVAGPRRHEEGILTAEVDLSRVDAARRLFDPVGHYNRPDVFQLSVDTRRRQAVTLITDDQADEPALPPTAVRAPPRCGPAR